MRIQSVCTNPYFVASQKGGQKKINNFKPARHKVYPDSVSFGNYAQNARYTRVYNPVQEAIEEEKYRQELLKPYFSNVYDSSGKIVLSNDGEPMTVLNPAIVDELDHAAFDFASSSGHGISRGSIRDAVSNFMINDDTIPDSFHNVLHGTSRESIENILKYGPDLRKTRNAAFGPGMYFALCEADAHDYSPAKLKADVIRSKRSNGANGKFVRLNDCFYNKIANSEVYNKLNQILEIEPEPLEYDPLRPAYIPNVKSEVCTRVLDEYCRNIIKDDLEIDAAYAAAPNYHTCLVVFNPDSVVNMSDYTQQPKDVTYNAFGFFSLW